MDKARLILEDGTTFEGRSIGTPGERIGEVALNTAVVGYQEIMTDPANAGKILVLTYPLIGNYGVAAKFNESRKCWISGLVIKESSRIYSNWQAEGPLEAFLQKEGVLTITDVDTRALAVHVRDHGEMRAIISTGNATAEKLVKKLKEPAAGNEKNFISEISVKKPTEVNSGAPGASIAILDLGMTNSFIKQLKTLGCNMTLLPYDTKADEILAMRPDGLIISGGPEDDTSLPSITKTVATLFGKIPMMAISTGHEVLTTALGGKLIRMKAGHRGVNYPVRSTDSYKGHITVQNHIFAADEQSLKTRKDVTITLRNVNDNSIEEMVSAPLKFISVQYYPASPGSSEINDAFRRFLHMTGGDKARPATNRRPGRKGGEVHYAKA